MLECSTKADLPCRDSVLTENPKARLNVVGYAKQGAGAAPPPSPYLVGTELQGDLHRSRL